MSFSDDEVERYARHLVLREVGGPGQQRLQGRQRADGRRGRSGRARGALSGRRRGGRVIAWSTPTWSTLPTCSGR